jgi:N-acetylglucosamine-6-sulfatase
MRRMVVVLASVALAVGLLFSGTYSGISADLRKAAAQTVPARPNIVFILTDDMRKDDLRYMPKTRTLLKREGMSFGTLLSPTPCAPLPGPPS